MGFEPTTSSFGSASSTAWLSLSHNRAELLPLESAPTAPAGRSLARNSRAPCADSHEPPSVRSNEGPTVSFVIRPRQRSGESTLVRRDLRALGVSSGSFVFGRGVAHDLAEHVKRELFELLESDATLPAVELREGIAVLRQPLSAHYIDTEVILLRSECNQVAVVDVVGHLVTDLLVRLGSGVADYAAKCA